MVVILLTFLLVIQASMGNPLNPACCASKTVGDDAYTLVNTSVSFPGECYHSCAYTKDSELGSLYCFARGDLPVHCTGEKPVDVSPCFPGPPGPTGCPPDNGLRITDEDPNTVSSRPSSDDCWNYCRALCSGTQCYCFAWTYNIKDELCYTFDTEPICYNTIKEDGWVSGALCFETYTGETLETEIIPGHVVKPHYKKYGPYGALPTAKQSFNDVNFLGENIDISQVDIYTGSFGSTTNDVIIGIRFYYGGLGTALHGNDNGTKKECKLSSGSLFNQVQLRSIDKLHSQNNLIYFIEFQSTDNVKCGAGSSPGTPHTIPPPGAAPQTLLFIKGYVTTSITQMLGSITFLFKDATP